MAAFRRRIWVASLVAFAAPACGKDDTPAFASSWTVRRVGPERCEVRFDEPPCPANAICRNPPPPQATACPAGIADQPVRIVRLVAGTCAVAPAGCADARCATVPTPCPDL